MNNLERKDKAVRDYYKNPIICKQCNQVIKIKKGQQPGEARRKKFCSRSCAATYNNKRYIKRKRLFTHPICPQCGGKKTFKAKVCHNCKVLNKFREVQKQPISRYVRNGNSRIKYSSIRHWAARAMLMYNKEKRCEHCGFDLVIEVCHIVPITSYTDDALMGEVNSKENLKYLCPNHHAMLDRGLLK